MSGFDRVALYVSDRGRKYTAPVRTDGNPPETHRMQDGEVLPLVMVVRTGGAYPITSGIMETARLEAQAARMRNDGARRFGRAS